MQYVIKNSKGNYIGIDHASGGYPYPTGFQLAKIWATKKEAFEYKQKFPDYDWTLHILKVETESTSWDV